MPGSEGQAGCRAASRRIPDFCFAICLLPFFVRETVLRPYGPMMVLHRRLAIIRSVPEAARPFRLGEAILLIVILAVGVRLHWLQSSVIFILPDDIRLISASHEIQAGAWRLLLAPQDIHLLPLYRLLRLPFDAHFPSWYVRFHALTVAAHLSSVVLLYLLARRQLHSPWAALVTTMLFAWSMVGDEAVVWKAATPFVFSWTFLLLALWLLTRPGPVWGAAAAGALLCAVGFFSGALFAIPGVLVAAWLLHLGSVRRAVTVCLGAWLVGSLAWIFFIWTRTDLTHYWRFSSATAGPLTRLAWAAGDTLHSYVYQLDLLVRLVPEQYAAPLAVLAIFALYLFRREINAPWIWSALALTLPPLFVTLLIRRDPHILIWRINRYQYQSQMLWIAVLGSLFDALLRRLRSQPHWRAALLATTPLLAGLYLTGQYGVARHHRDSFLAQPMASPHFWLGWNRFFRLASTHSAELASPLRIPFVEALPGLSLHVVYHLCYPQGLPGLIAEHAVLGADFEQDEFLQEIDRTRTHPPGLPP